VAEEAALNNVQRSLHRARSDKKDDEPLLNLTEAMSHCSREKVLISEYRGISVYSMNKTGG
jgi:hypothetical protein